jgi:cyclophilin family peptidyl-prolyl cis-trans isomerase
MTTSVNSVRRLLVVTCSALCLAAPSWAQDAPTVKFHTTVGDFVVEVYPDKAPKTVDNFLQYVKAKHYDGTIFHRVINNFMVQGGGYSKTLSQKPTRPPIPLEAANGLTNDLGTIAMARTGEPNSATSQFFINVKDNAFLNAKGKSDGYTVFGKVISGMDIIEKMKAVPTGPSGMFPSDVPVTPIVINSATLAK